MPMPIQTIPQLNGQYGGILQGKEISAQLNSDDHKGSYITENLNVEMGDVRFSAEPIHGSSGFILDVYDMDGNMTSNVIIDKDGRVKHVGTTDKNTGIMGERKLDTIV